MATEQCPICGEHVPFSNTVHVMLNPRDDGGVIDFYVCRECYEADIEPLFADAIVAEAAGAQAEEVDESDEEDDESAESDADDDGDADSETTQQATPETSSPSE